MDRHTTLVTGGAGFIGSALVERLLDAEETVIVVDNLFSGDENNVPDRAVFIEGDITDAELYEELNEYAIDTVFHLGAQSGNPRSFEDPEYDFKSHAPGTFRLLRWCQSAGVDRVLYASSMAVYGDSNTEPATENQPTDPKSYYAAGKAAAENYVSLFDKLGLDTTIFRLFIVYGPNQHLGRSQGMVSIYLSFLFDEDVLTIKGSLERVRDCIYIDDVVDVWMQARDNPQTYGETYNVGRGERVTVREILETMKTCYGEPDYPMKVEAGTPGDQFAIYADTSKLKKDLNWSPEVSLEEGLNRMIEFYTDLS